MASQGTLSWQPTPALAEPDGLSPEGLWTCCRAHPFHDLTVTVTHCGRICFQGRKINISHAFAGQNIGVTQVGERVWLVSSMQ